MVMNYQEYDVHKFGGTSLADAERFRVVKSLLRGKNEIIVVSAIKGCTTTLQTLVDTAKRAQDFASTLSALQEQHSTLVASLLAENNRSAVVHDIEADCRDIFDILHAVSLTGSYSKEIQDLILGFGEIWSAKILTAYLAETAKVAFLDASKVVYAFEKHKAISINWQRSQTALQQFLENLQFDQLVVTGFIAATEVGKRTTLGRNGSDFSGAIFASLFAARCLYIWTDVDGIYTADPQRVRSAFVIEALSYKEALELAYFGAKVLHPMTIAPLMQQQIPLYIKNSFNSAAKGTYITAQPQSTSYPIKGLTSIDNIALINIEGAGMIGVSGIAARVFQILQHEHISVILISQASSEHSICFAVANADADIAEKELKENLQFELDRGQIEDIVADKSCSILAAVGDNMVGQIGIAGKLCATLAKANINIHAISQGSSERNISVVIKNADMNRALQAVHAGFYLSAKTISVGLIGPGQVGRTLLQQIHEALHSLQAKYQVNLCVRGIMNSQHMLLSHKPIDLTNWPEQLANSSVAQNLTDFVNHILVDDVPHAVIIDCTANPTVSQYYVDFLSKSIHVITPNKHANAGDMHYYKKIKAVAAQKTSYYLYEATVCAGLPVINTLQDIIKTGDEVIKVEGVVSGTLSFIFNELANGRAFSAIVIEARQRGFTEPDPREDLSGMDVARKLVCLAREIGYEVSLQDVKVFDLVPPALKSCSVQEFLEKLPEYDDQMNTMVAQAIAKNERLCYVGAIDQEGKLAVAIDAFSQSHPFARLKGTDNMLIFHTRRYLERPLIIQGPGAGAEVTAAGIFADLLRLVAYLS